MSGNLAFAVVVPFFNEEKTVAGVCRELHEVLENALTDGEVILIDDGSSDRTGAALDEIAQGWMACRVYHLAENQGQSAALLFGFAKTTAPVLVTMDGDGQNDPHDIPKLLARLEEADMVVGARVDRQDTWARRKISRVANLIRSDGLGDGVSDSGCALKVFRREVVNAFIPIRTLYSFMPALAVAAGFRVVEEPVRHRARLGGTSKYTVRSFLLLPIVDFLGLRWFRARRCRVAPRSLPNEMVAPWELGAALYQRLFRRWLRTVALVLVLGSIAFLALRPRPPVEGPAGRRIGLLRAERIALQHVPKGQLGDEELHTTNGQLTWTIDVRPPGQCDLNEIDISALDGRLLAVRLETAEEDAFEVAMENADHAPHDRRPR
ncbi:MAG: glycosyltransferase family 2 protein [Chthoniobacterales bacterium]